MTAASTSDQSASGSEPKRLTYIAAQLVVIVTMSAVAPVQTLLSLAVAAVTLVVSGYVALASLTGAVVLVLLVAIGKGVFTFPCALAVAGAVLLFVIHGASIGRLRAGEEPRIRDRGTASSSPTRSTAIGLWDPPAPHGLLNRSALSPGALFSILAAIAGAVTIATNFA